MKETPILQLNVSGLLHKFLNKWEIQMAILTAYSMYHAQ